MQTTKHIAILLILALLGTSAAHGGEAEYNGAVYKKVEVVAEKPATASCLVKITGGSSVLPVDLRTIDMLVESSGVAGKAAKEVLGVPHKEALDFFDITPVSEKDRRRSTDDPFIFNLRIFLPDKIATHSEEFMAAIVDNLKDNFNMAFDESFGRLGNKLEAANQEVTQTEEQLKAMQAELREISTQYLSARDCRKRVLELTQAIRNDDERIALGKVLVEEIIKRIDKTNNDLKERLENDPIAAELDRVIRLNEKLYELAEQKFNADAASAVELVEASHRLTEAGINLARQLHPLRKSAGGELLDSLTRELSSKTIGVVECEAKKAMAEKQLVETEPLIEKADRYEVLSIKISNIRGGFEGRLRRRDALAHELSLLQPPLISTIGGN